MDGERFGYDGRHSSSGRRREPQKREARETRRGPAGARAGVLLGPGAPYCDDRSPEHTATDYSGEQLHRQEAQWTFFS